MYAHKEFDIGHYRKNHIQTAMVLRRLCGLILNVDCSVLPELH